VTQGSSIFSNERVVLPKDLQREESLVRLEGFYRRVADLERAYRPLLRSEESRSEASVQFLSSVCRACEALLNGLSQEEEQVFRLVGH